MMTFVIYTVLFLKVHSLIQCAAVEAHHGVHLEVRGQLSKDASPCSPSGAQGLNSDSQAWW